MSNVDNEGLRTLDEMRAQRGRWYGQIDTTARLNPGELEEIEAAARRGEWTDPLKALALVNTISALARRIAKRFNETAEARQDAAAARERAESAERRVAELEAEVARRYTAEQVAEYQTSEAELVSAPLKRRIAQLEQELDDRLQSLEKARTRAELLSDAVTRAERAEREAAWFKREVTRLNRHVKDADQLAQDTAGSAARERQLREKADQKAEEARQEVWNLRTRVNMLEVAVADWERAGEMIREAVFNGRTVQALAGEPERAFYPLAEAVRTVRGALGGSGGTVDS